MLTQTRRVWAPANRDFPDIHRIIERIREGQIDLFSEVVRRYYDSVRKVVLAMVASSEETENLTQQCFVRAYNHLAQYRPTGDFEHWIKAIARNVVRDELKRSFRETRRLKAYRWYLVARTATELADDDRLREDALAQCRQLLPENAARALELRYERGLSFNQIAPEIGRSVVATRQLLTRVRIALKRCIEQRMQNP